jgi:hypothetical protein
MHREGAPLVLGTKSPDATLELADRRCRRLELVEYDLGNGRAENAIVDLESAWAAWFADPETNTIGVLEYR